MASIIQRIAELEVTGARAAVVTLVRASGSTPREPGAKMIVFEDGRSVGTIGGGKVEQQAIEAAKEAVAEQQPRYIEFKLSADLGMCCGGQLALFIEPFSTPHRLLIFGAGHVGTALCRYAASAGFAISIADERE